MTVHAKSGLKSDRTSCSTLLYLVIFLSIFEIKAVSAVLSIDMTVAEHRRLPGYQIGRVTEFFSEPGACTAAARYSTKALSLSFLLHG